MKADTNPLADDLAHILAHTRELWEAFRGRNIFITGGTGFFGRWLLESFAHANSTLELNAHIVVLSRDPAAFQAKAPHLATDPAICFVRGDVRSFTAAGVRAQLPADTYHSFGFVIHAATESATGLTARDPLLMLDTVVQGTRAALDFAVETGARRFLLTSSGAVYGRQPTEVTHVSEEYLGAPDVTNPSNAYGEGKRMAELLCATYAKHHTIEPVIARCFAFVGPFLPLDAHFAVGNFIRDAFRGGIIEVNGDGTARRSYLYAADLMIWLWTLLVRGLPGRPYNVGSEDDLSIKDVAEIVALAGGIAPVHVKGVPDAQKPVERYVPSCRRAREELGLTSLIFLPEGIKRTLCYLRITNRSL